MDNPLDDRHQLEDRISAFVMAGLDDFRIRAWTVIRAGYLRRAHAARNRCGRWLWLVSSSRVLLPEHLATRARRVRGRRGCGRDRCGRRPLPAEALARTVSRSASSRERCSASSVSFFAFGLTLAVGRYQDRRADVVTDANTIGTAYLRAQTIAEPQRSRSLELLRSYNDLAIRVTSEIPGSAALRATTAAAGTAPTELWRLGGEAMNARPRDTAPRLYVDSLNAMIDQQTTRCPA